MHALQASAKFLTCGAKFGIRKGAGLSSGLAPVRVLPQRDKSSEHKSMDQEKLDGAGLYTASCALVTLAVVLYAADIQGCTQ